MLEVKQKINLYLPRFQPAKLPAETKKLMLIVITVIGIFSLVIMILAVMHSLLEQELEEQKLEQAELNEALTRAISQIPNVTADSNLINRIAREKIVIKKKQQVIAYLYQDTINEGENFTDLVDQLAQQSVAGIWLAKFEVLNKGKDIQLFGYARAPKQVSKYIEMLGNQASYKGRNFQQIHIKHSEQGWNEFYISTLTLDQVLSINDAAETGGQ